jgi:hypothetical protein
MARVMVFIDGFNLYHSIKDQIDPPPPDGPFPPKTPQPHFKQYKWLNLKKLMHLFVPKEDTIEEIYYFTTLAEWNKSKAAKHKKYIQALQNVGVKIVLGNFRKIFKKCNNCSSSFATHVE